jgi:hypothetical protein
MTYRYESVDRETLEQAAREALERPEPSHMRDSRLYVTHAPVISWAVNGDDLVEQSNYLTVTKYLTDLAGTDDQLVIDAQMQDWAVGPLRQTFVQVRNEVGAFTHVWREAVAIALYLRDKYPVFDDEDHSALEFSLWTKQVEEAMAEATYEYVDLDGDKHLLLQNLAIGDLQIEGAIEHHGCPENDALLDAYVTARDTYYGDLAREHAFAQIDGQGALAL